jgi:holliday junction DNA helicase RuvB
MSTDRAIRPACFNDYVGQTNAVENLRILVKSAQIRNEPVDHILFTGPPGLGKTSLANALANEIGSKLHTINATTIENKGDLIAVLSCINKKDVLFIDEIHALGVRIEEVLYTAMEDFKLDIAAGGDTVTVEIEPFTVIGATTVSGLVSKPLLDRFGEIVVMEPYNETELSQIARENFAKLGLNVEEEAARNLARRSRGVPRILNRLIRRVRDFSLVSGNLTVNLSTVESVCTRLGIDGNGLDKSSRLYLAYLSNASEPVGVKTISSAINEDINTIQNNIEPHLIFSGFVQKNGKGRTITEIGRNCILRG